MLFHLFTNSIADRFSLKVYWQILLTVIVRELWVFPCKPYSKGKQGWLDSGYFTDPLHNHYWREESLPHLGQLGIRIETIFFVSSPFTTWRCTTGNTFVHFSSSCYQCFSGIWAKSEIWPVLNVKQTEFMFPQPPEMQEEHLGRWQSLCLTWRLTGSGLSWFLLWGQRDLCFQPIVYAQWT